MKIVKEYIEKKKDKEDENEISTLIQKVRNCCLLYYQFIITNMLFFKLL